MTSKYHTFDFTEPQMFAIDRPNKRYEVKVTSSPHGYHLAIKINYLPSLDPDVLGTAISLDMGYIMLPETEYKPPKEEELSFTKREGILFFLHLLHHFDNPFMIFTEINERFRCRYKAVCDADGPITVSNEYWSNKFPTAYPEVVPIIMFRNSVIASPTYNGNLWFPERNLSSMITKLFRACQALSSQFRAK